MTVTLHTELDANTTTPARARTRNRRPWLAWVCVLVAGMIFAMAAGLFWLGAYQPLRFAGGHVGISGSVQSEISSIENAYGSDFRITRPRPGDTFDVFFSLTNTGPLSITIDKIAQPFNPQGTVGDPLKPDSTTPGAVRIGPDTGLDEFPDRLPYVLAPGASAQVRLSFGILACATTPRDDLTEWVTTVPITFRALGISRTEPVNVGFAMSFDSKPVCP